jgi:hypothetical protein
MNHNTADTFQKLTKRSSAKQYEEDGYKSKHKNSYSEQRKAKRNWREE